MPVTASSITPRLQPARSGKEDNKLRPQDRPAHEWYRFVLSFPPHLVREYVSRFKIQAGQVVLDPFCGTGTTIVECKKLGFASVGIEPTPMAHFASSVKTDWNLDGAAFLRHAHKVAEIALTRLQEDGVNDEPTGPLFRTRRKSSPHLRTLP